MTSTVAIATTAADAAAAAAIAQHHAELLGALTTHVEALMGAVSATDATRVEVARADLVRWCADELFPHAAGEEEILYPAAHEIEAGRPLVIAMIEEHSTIRGLGARIAAAQEPVRAAAAAAALQVLFESHMTKENQQILPLLAGSPRVSLAALVDKMHEALASPPDGSDHHRGPEPASTEASDRHGCSCGESEEGLPELDARFVPHAIRHATIFGALDVLAPGNGMVLVAPHDPLPLLDQLEQRDPGAFEVSYLERGPDAWRLRFLRASN